MININLNTLNHLEQTIYETISSSAKIDKNLSIVKASEICGVSSSKISKTAKKLGFKNYKDFIRFCSDELACFQEKNTSSELVRVSNFLDNFDDEVVTHFIEKMNKYNKIVLYGLGPSFICCQYLEYKLRMYSNKLILAINDEVQINNMVDSDTLFVIFSVTGQFASFNNIVNLVNKNEGNILIVFEEYNSNTYTDTSDIIYLSKYQQDSNLEPYEKTRTVLFIFIEEVCSKILKLKSESNSCK